MTRLNRMETSSFELEMLLHFTKHLSQSREILHQFTFCSIAFKRRLFYSLTNFLSKTSYLSISTCTWNFCFSHLWTISPWELLVKISKKNSYSNTCNWLPKKSRKSTVVCEIGQRRNPFHLDSIRISDTSHDLNSPSYNEPGFKCADGQLSVNNGQC